MRLDGKVAVVTGAASGIGRALVQELVERGARVAALDVDEDGLRSLRECATWHCDVTDETTVDRVAREVESTLGTPDLLFVNAGVAAVGGLDEVPVTDARWVIEVNVLGAVIVTRSFAPAMVAAGRGHIAFTASIAGLIGVPDMGVYSASKFAVVGFAESLRSEMVGTGVSVTTICPGYVRTGLHRATRYHTTTLQHLLDAPPKVMSGLDASSVARRSIDAALAGRAVVPMGVERIGALIGRLSPTFYPRAAAGLRRFLQRRAPLQSGGGVGRA